MGVKGGEGGEKGGNGFLIRGDSDGVEKMDYVFGYRGFRRGLKKWWWWWDEGVITESEGMVRD